MTAEMIDYVRAELASGKSPDDVRRALSNAGWPPGDAEQALSLALGQTVGSATTPPPPPPGASAGGWAIGSGGRSYRRRITTVRQMTPAQMLIMGMIFALIGGLLVFFGFRSYFAAAALAKNGVKTEGVVIRIEEKIETDDDGTSRTYRPIVEYTRDGVKREYASNLWRNPSPFSEGQKVPMIYDPVGGKAAIATGGEIYGPSYLMLGIGAVFFLAGLAAAVGSRKRSAAIAATDRTPPQS